MYPVEFLLLLFLAFAIWLWQNAARSKELAKRIALRSCNDSDVLLLDDSVAFKRLHIIRKQGALRLIREYQFEFTSDGSQRYKGSIRLNKRSLPEVKMDAYRLPSTEI